MTELTLKETRPMDSELTFLLKLLLDYKLSKAVKDLIASRIKDVEATISATKPTPPTLTLSRNRVVQQAPSTQAILDRDIDQLPHEQPIITTPTLPISPPIPTTQAAAQALAERQAIINQAMSGKGNSAPKLHRGGSKNT